jgi:hypothetical protein
MAHSLAFSPDGKLLASDGNEKAVKLWDVNSGTLRQTLPGRHEDFVSSVAFSPDGKVLASGSGGGPIRLWDVNSGTLKQTLTGHNSCVNSLAFSPDRKLLASGSMDKTIKLWRRGENVTGSIGQENSVETTLVQRPRTPGEVRENVKDGLKYVWIPSGTFMMGCSPGDNGCLDYEKPAHQVTIAKGFWLGQTEVTVGAYKRFTGATGRQLPPPLDVGGRSLNPGWLTRPCPFTM